MADNRENPDFRLIPPEEYAPIQQKALRKLAGLPNTTAEDVKELSEILGLSEVVTWKPTLRVVT